MNFVDRIVGAFSPAAGIRRVFERKQYEAVQRSMNAAKPARSTNWKPGTGSINSEINSGLHIVRNRSRDLILNNGYLKKAVKTLVSNRVGTGIIPKWEDPKVKALWDYWSKYEADYDEVLSLNARLAQLCRGEIESGEILLRFHVLDDPKLKVPLQVQVLESDHLDSFKTGRNEMGFAIAGVQFNDRGKRIGYWLFKTHPGEYTIPRDMVSEFVSAEFVLHFFDAMGRPNQVRGFPALSCAIWKVNDLDEYQEAHAVRKKIEACFAVFVTSQQNDMRIGVPGVAGQSDPGLEDIGPGMVHYLRPGEGVDFSSPTPSDGYEETTRTELRAIAAGSEVSYEQMTGDYSQVNFTSGRMGKLEFRQQTEQYQELLFLPMVMTRIVRMFVKVAYLRGAITKQEMPLSFTCPRVPLLDVQKEALGYKTLQDQRVLSRHQVQRELGYDPEEMDAEIRGDDLAPQLQPQTKAATDEET
ncbi:phage portal protein [Undibacterium squillarum]|uniref:Phage portal protein n=1 Tax=Undibacterium squillarum TaxID=1131567 RepID=A0ABQ2Y207_9BURK|nr:phage portal protein [Undibacterium squillarum]GGX53042.1 phage portal protein [Undibacterium squillarum]